MNRIEAYSQYILYAARITLQSRVAGSFFGYLWWVLDPLLMMLVFVLVFDVIFNKGKPNYPVFTFVGLISWKFFSSCLTDSTSSIKSKMSIIEQVPVPKFIFPLVELAVQLFLMLFGFAVLFLMLLVFGIPFTWHLLELPAILATNTAMAYGLMLFISHLGVFFTDIKNILASVLRFWMYLSPVFYDLSYVPESIRAYWWFNPLTPVIESYRNVTMYGRSPLYESLGLWFVLSLVIAALGILLQHRFQNIYAKVN